jgi:hypothetical protein
LVKLRNSASIGEIASAEQATISALNGRAERAISQV